MKILCILVLRTKLASALDGLILLVECEEVASDLGLVGSFPRVPWSPTPFTASLVTNLSLYG